MKRKLFKAISLILCVTMLTTAMPVGVYAQEENDIINESSSQNLDNMTIEYEIESKRTENSKTYVTSTGEFYQITSTTPIHESNGSEWKDVIDSNTNISTVKDVQEYIQNEASVLLAENSFDNSNDNTEGNTTQTTGFKTSSDISSQMVSYPDDTGYYIRGNNTGGENYLFIKLQTPYNSVYINHAKLSANCTLNSTIDPYAKIYRISDSWSNDSLVNDGEIPNIDDYDVFDRIDLSSYSNLETNNNIDTSIDLTLFCRYSSIGLYENNGLAIIPEENTNITINSAYLEIYYRELGDVDQKIDSETIDLGRAGTVYINDYTCSPVVVRDDISIFSEVSQVSVQTILNPLAIDENSTDGSNTRTNYYSTITYNNGEYLWKNCNGQNIYFTLKNTTVSNETYIGVDSSGTQYSLVLSASNNNIDHTAYNKIAIHNDSDDTTYKFGIHKNSTYDRGYLTKIVDSKANSISISYTNENNGLEDNIYKITDGNGKIYKYNYLNGLLNSIDVHYVTEDEESGESTTANVKINDNNVSVSFQYDDNKQLTNVAYSDGYSVNYVYNKGMLSNISTYNEENIELKSISFSYVGNVESSHLLNGYTIKNKSKTVSDIKINSISGSINKREFYDKVKDSTKSVMYDANSNLIYLNDYDNNEYFLNYTDNKLSKLIQTDNSATSYIINGGFNTSSNWKRTIGASIVESAPDHFGNGSSEHAASINKANGAANLYQEINNDDKGFEKNSSYIVNAEAYLKQGYPLSGKRDLSIEVYYKDSNNNKIVIGKSYFDTFIINDWQKTEMLFTIPEYTSTIYVSCICNYMPNKCYFDNIEMYDATSKNVIDVSDGSLTSEYTLNYNNNGTLESKTKLSANNQQIGTYYRYDSNNYLSSVNNNGKVTYYDYNNSNGLLLSKGINASHSKNAQYFYNGIGALTAVNQAITQIDSKIVNNETHYTYDDDKISSISHNGCTYQYTYDTSDNLTNIAVYKKEPKSDEQTIDYSISYKYLNDKIGTITYGSGATISYMYDDNNNITKIIYNNGKTDNNEIEYVYSYQYDINGCVTKFTDEVNGTETLYSKNGYTITKDGKTIYSNNGETISIFGANLTVTSSESKNSDSLTSITNYNSDISKVKTEVTTDSLNRVTKSEFLNTNISNSFGIRNIIDEFVSYSGTNKTTDLVSHSISTIFQGPTGLTDVSKRLVEEYSYKYNSVGLITDVYKKTTISKIPAGPNAKSDYDTNDGDLINHYEYDEAGQIILEVDLQNYTAIKYLYNAGGNIVEKTTYKNASATDTSGFEFDKTNKTIKSFNSNGQSINYLYQTNGVTDYLTSYNNNTISYDAAGNPLTYYGNSATESVGGKLTWNGNLLVSFNDTRYNRGYYEYKYDGDGRRTFKSEYDKDISLTNPIKTIEYIWEGDTLVGYRFRYYDSDNNFKLAIDKVIKLIYNGNELLGVAIISDNSDPNFELTAASSLSASNTYAFAKDGLGNITTIYNSDEQAVLLFTYDAYGNITPKVSGNIVQKALDENPGNGSIVYQFILGLVMAATFTGQYMTLERGYRGYIYDSETGLYYFQNRYYSPSWGRYINASDPLTLSENIGEINGANLFNFCNNNPINNTSTTGFNVNQTAISNNILPSLGINDSNMTNEGKATASEISEISHALNILGIKLSTNTDSNVNEYWNTALGNVDNTVGPKNGIDYINQSINKNSSTITEYSVKSYNTPYKISESIN